MPDLRLANKDIDRVPIRLELADARYPERLKAVIGIKAPEHLDMLGNLELLQMPGVGICGSRKPSERGVEITRDCADQMVDKNILVVSGNSLGVDLEAHASSLRAGGRTILVLPEGINRFRIRKALKPVWDWDRVLVISQFNADASWKVYRAMDRNQLINHIKPGDDRH